MIEKYEDIGFTVVYEIEEAFKLSVNFKVYEIIGHQEGQSGNFDVPYYEGIGGCGSDDKSTTNIGKANTYMTGMVKWDGCSHYYFGDEEGYIHLCGKGCIRGHIEIVDKVYKRCGEIMVKNGVSLLEGEF